MLNISVCEVNELIARMLNILVREVNGLLTMQFIAPADVHKIAK